MWALHNKGREPSLWSGPIHTPGPPCNVLTGGELCVPADYQGSVFCSVFHRESVCLCLSGMNILSVCLIPGMIIPIYNS